MAASCQWRAIWGTHCTRMASLTLPASEASSALRGWSWESRSLSRETRTQANMSVGPGLWRRGRDENEEVGRVDMGVLEAHEEGDELGELVAEEGRGGRGGRGGGATMEGSRRGRGCSRRAPRCARPGGGGIRGEQDGLLEVIHGGGGGGGGIWAGAEGGKEEKGRGGRVGEPPPPRGTASPPCSHPCSCSCSRKGGENLEEQRVEADTRVPLPYTQNRDDEWRGCWSK
ncbi:hypothetical protein OsJ_20792 [Oryza sativa Japonica Group]|uniref:Uncharacterized protein n=1 Tax=Oryza sativa subsp. japonica TaxID=39947 RepID=A3BA72_ORYSJ|nr:hypothetical protein OsJ_20792 [Oryza sativa Japonica Group]